MILDDMDDRVKVIWMTAEYQLSESLVKEDPIMPGCSVWRKRHCCHYDHRHHRHHLENQMTWNIIRNRAKLVKVNNTSKYWRREENLGETNYAKHPENVQRVNSELRHLFRSSSAEKYSAGITTVKVPFRTAMEKGEVLSSIDDTHTQSHSLRIFMCTTLGHCECYNNEKYVN